MVHLLSWKTLYLIPESFGSAGWRAGQNWEGTPAQKSEWMGNFFDIPIALISGLKCQKKRIPVLGFLGKEQSRESILRGF